jgi:hypothetical protein
MGIWVGKPRLGNSETVIWRHLANRTQSMNRAVGGCLYLTSARLLFEPNRVDAATGGQAWSASLLSIKAVGRQPRDGSPFSGGSRDRLIVELADGTAEMFIVNGLEEVIGVLQQAASQS